MTAIPYDTHKFIRTIKDSGIPENQAEAIAEALGEPAENVCITPTAKYQLSASVCDSMSSTSRLSILFTRSPSGRPLA